MVVGDVVLGAVVVVPGVFAALMVVWAAPPAAELGTSFGQRTQASPPKRANTVMTPITDTGITQPGRRGGGFPRGGAGGNPWGGGYDCGAAR